MLEIVNDEKDIVKYHNIFHQKLEQILTERHESIIGFPGGARREKIFYSPILNMWYVSSEDVDGWKRIALMGILKKLWLCQIALIQ